MKLLFDYLTGELGLDARMVAEAMWRDYQRGGRRDKPDFLSGFLPSGRPAPVAAPEGGMLAKRQGRHRRIDFAG
jgi:hypothetical protein